MVDAAKTRVIAGNSHHHGVIDSCQQAMYIHCFCDNSPVLYSTHHQLKIVSKFRGLLSSKLVPPIRLSGPSFGVASDHRRAVSYNYTAALRTASWRSLPSATYVILGLVLRSRTINTFFNRVIPHLSVSQPQQEACDSSFGPCSGRSKEAQWQSRPS